MKIIKIIFVLALLLISSCSFFRTVGLYNTPPKYSETYEEITGQKFINHPNKTENLTLTLESVKPEYSPYEDIRLVVKVFNKSQDTMYIAEPDIISITYCSRELIIRDSLNKPVKYNENIEHVSWQVVKDEYGRIVEPIIAPNSTKIYPMDSLVKHFSFRTGGRIIQNMTGFFTLLRENVPGTYTVKYVQGHEEYDEIKGPVKTKLESQEVIYKIAEYTQEEKIIREDAEKVLLAISKDADSLKIDSLYSDFKKNYPDNLYIPQINEYLNMTNYIKNNKK